MNFMRQCMFISFFIVAQCLAEIDGQVADGCSNGYIKLSSGECAKAAIPTKQDTKFTNAQIIDGERQGPADSYVTELPKKTFACDIQTLSKEEFNNCVASKMCPEGKFMLGDRCETPEFKITLGHLNILAAVEQVGGYQMKLAFDRVAIEMQPPVWTEASAPSKPKVTQKQKEEYSVLGACPKEIRDTSFADAVDRELIVVANAVEKNTKRSTAPLLLVKNLQKNGGFTWQSAAKCKYRLVFYNWDENKVVPLNEKQKEQMARGQALSLDDDQMHTVQLADDMAKEAVESATKEESAKQGNRLDTLLNEKDPRTATDAGVKKVPSKGVAPRVKEAPVPAVR